MARPQVLSLWVILLLLAEHKDEHKFIWNGSEQTIKRGQLLTGRKRLSQISGLSEQQARSALATLKATNRITIKGYSKFSIITINKYDEYQLDNQQKRQQITNKQPTDNQQITTSNNDKNEKNEKKGGAALILLWEEHNEALNKAHPKLKDQIQAQIISAQKQGWEDTQIRGRIISMGGIDIKPWEMFVKKAGGYKKYVPPKTTDPI
jgi:hypothetical protein